MQKRNNWFVNYKEIRNTNYRKEKFILHDFINKTVLDIGCNTGEISRLAYNYGANYVLGIDYDENVINIARNESLKYNNITYLVDDLDNYMLYTNLNKFDTVMFLSVIGTQELENRYGILSKINNLTNNTLYIEGHHVIFKKEELFFALLKYTTFTEIEYLGKNYDNENDYKINKYRDIFRCTRKIYNHAEIIIKITSLIKTDKLIVIQGHGGSGKTTLKNILIKYLINNKLYNFSNKISDHIYVSNDLNICIIDDVSNKDLVKDLYNKYKCIIYFDYRCLEYLNKYKINTLIIMKYNIENRFKNRPQFINNRSVCINNFIDKIYHVEEYK
tara:strand:+ start:3917 stop:4909 length:993 start_codon:yes stop_codon:yes gene_type:complete